LHPTPYRGVIGFQAALLQELFDIAQRQLVSKVPTNRTKDDSGLGLPPFKDRWSSRHESLFSLPARGSEKLQHYPSQLRIVPHEFLFSPKPVFDIVPILPAT
jgi:hypothetical protein